jgi:hypothetical protein
VWSEIFSMIAAHGHGDATEIVWIDDGPPVASAAMDLPKQPERNSHGWPVLEPHECTGVGE